MVFNSAEEHAFFNRRIWNALSSIEFADWDGEISEERDFGPIVDLEAQVSFDEAQLMQLAAKKRDYLEAARQEEVSDEDVVDALAEDIATSFQIVLNRVGYDVPPEGLYKRINEEQWKQEETEEYYSRYQDLLREITADMDDIPSIPGLYRPFLFKVVQSDDHELPPEGAVDDILSEHIDSMRAEQNSREGVSKLKQELESRGVNARTAASVAQSMEDYLKTDKELEELNE